ncbi:MAG: 30S ribosomal protein S8 [Desulfobacteraceae bacterium]|jgi:small subunit ribosomal protein S8
MAMTDPIGDMLTRIRNALIASYDTVDIPRSKLKMSIAKVLKSEGFIKNYRIMDEGTRGTIRVFLKYDENGVPVIGGLKRVSKPSRRFYTKSDKIPKVLGGLGVNILSTSKGVMTDREARKVGIGGEVLCAVW